MSSLLGKILVFTLPGLLLGFVSGYVAKAHMSEEKIEQSRLFSYMIIVMWMYLVMMQVSSTLVNGLPKFQVPWAVHTIAAIPIGYVFDVDIQNIWKR